MNALDRCLFSLALVLAVFGSVALYAQGQEAKRQAAACQKMQLQQFAEYGGL
jgi:hypothetical protein